MRKDIVEDFFICYFSNERSLESLAPLLLAQIHLWAFKVSSLCKQHTTNRCTTLVLYPLKTGQLSLISLRRKALNVLL